MRRSMWFVVSLMAATLVPGTLALAGGGFHSFCERSRLDWHRNHAWPQPFIAQDRMAICNPFQTMAVKGWWRQNTLTSYHFHPETHELTEAGRLKVRDIVIASPESQRTVFVVNGFSDQATSIRTDSVQQTIAGFVNTGAMPEVRHLVREPRAWTAEEINLINRSYSSTMPSPRLPTGTSTSSAGP